MGSCIKIDDIKAQMRHNFKLFIATFVFRYVTKSHYVAVYKENDKTFDFNYVKDVFNNVNHH